jgi:hypothetical protein
MVRRNELFPSRLHPVPHLRAAASQPQPFRGVAKHARDWFRRADELITFNCGSRSVAEMRQKSVK